MKKCRECGGELDIQGTDGRGNVEVECQDCGDYTVVEPDGLGCGGEEWVEAMMMDAGL